MTTLTAPARAYTAGALCVAGAVIGIAGGLVMAFTAPAVRPDRFSYPFTPTGHVIAEISFAANHLLLLAGVLGVGRAAATGRGRLGRTGIALTVAGLVALTLCEVGAVLLADSAFPTARTDQLGIGYGASSILIGLGLTLAGVAVIRARRWTGWPRYIVLACGLAVFVIVIPAVAGPMVAGRFALVAWMLLWAGLGIALTRSSQPGRR
jgi:hypothetical protein